MTPHSLSSGVSESEDFAIAAHGAREPPSNLFACAPSSNQSTISSLRDLEDDLSLPSRHERDVELSRLSGAHLAASARAPRDMPPFVARAAPI